MNVWTCADCGYDGFKTGVLRSTVGEVSVAFCCPACGSWLMFRDDPLSEIEREHEMGDGDAV